MQNSVLRVLFPLLVLWGMCPWLVAQPPSRAGVTREVQRRVVKVYGAGGMAGLEAYQSGCLVSPDGHVATAWSYVLDVDSPLVVLDDGRKFEATIVGFEPNLELAVLKLEATDLPFFPMSGDLQVEASMPVLAVSNLFSIAAGSEPASAMQGYIAAESNLAARRGTFKTAYDGRVFILDLVANNPGAAGGALVDVRGNLLGMLGKELRDDRTGVWLNYAIPTEVMRAAIGDIIAGRQSVRSESSQPLARDQAHSLEKLGLVMIPNVLENTPAYIDRVVPKSPADLGELRADDLILLVDGQRVGGQQALIEMLRSIDVRDALTVTVQRGSQIVSVTMRKP